MTVPTFAVGGGASAGGAVVVTPVSGGLAGGLPAGGVLFFLVGAKDAPGSGAIVCQTASHGLTKLGEQASVTGVLGVDTGPVRVAAFSREIDGTELSTYTFGSAGNQPNVQWGIPMAVSGKGAGQVWSLAAASGVDLTGGTPWSVTTGAIDLATDDLCVVGSVTPTDIAGGSAFSAESASEGSLTFGAATEIAEAFTSTNNDIGGFLFRAPVTAGADATATPTLTATVSGDTSSRQYGASILLRFRLVYPPPGVPTAVASPSHDDESIDLTWGVPATGGPVTGYEITPDGEAGPFTDVGNVLLGSLTGLTELTAYDAGVRAYGPGGHSAVVDLSVTTDATPPPGAYVFDVAVGEHTWHIVETDPAEIGTVLAGLKVLWSARQDDGWPTQHNPVQATFGIIVPEAVDLTDVDLGAAVYIKVEIDDVTLVEFGGTVRDIESRPHRLGMVYQITALDYLVQLREETIHAEITDAGADAEDIWDILTDGVLPSGMPSLFDPPDVPYPGLAGTIGSTFEVDGKALDVLTGWFGANVAGGPTGFRNIIVPNLTDGLPDPDHPYHALRAVQEVGTEVTIDANRVPTKGVAFRRLRQEPNRAEEWQGGVIQFANERDHDGIPTITRVLNNDDAGNVPTTSIAWIATNLEDLPNQWSTVWTLRAWEEPSLVEGWFTLPEAMRTLVRIEDIDPRHNPSGETSYAGMLAGAALVFDAHGRWRVDFTLRRSVPAGTEL